MATSDPHLTAATSHAGADFQLLVEFMAEKLRQFAAQPIQATKDLRKLFGINTPLCVRAALLLLGGEGNTGPAFKVLASMVVNNTLVYELLEDPEFLSLEAAMNAARAIARLGPCFAHDMVARIAEQTEAKRAGSAVDRLVTIVGGIYDGIGRAAPLMRLTRDQNPRVRSKATLLVGQVIGRDEWLSGKLSDPDPRVRANAIEAIWDDPTPEMRVTLRHLFNDPNPRIVGNALVALLRVGDPHGVLFLEKMVQHEQPAFRVTAAWVIGFLGEPQFRTLLESLRDDRDAKVRSHVEGALAKLAKKNTPAPAAPAETPGVETQQVR